MTIDLDKVEPTGKQLRQEQGDRGLNDWRECPWCLRKRRSPGMPRCHGCWEVKGNLDAFLCSEAGREYVRRALANVVPSHRD